MLESSAMPSSMRISSAHNDCCVIEKLGAHSKLEAVVIAMREGLGTTAP